MKNLTDYLLEKIQLAEEVKERFSAAWCENEKRIVELNMELRALKKSSEQRIWELEAELHSYANAGNSVEIEKIHSADPLKVFNEQNQTLLNSMLRYDLVRSFPTTHVVDGNPVIGSKWVRVANKAVVTVTGISLLGYVVSGDIITHPHFDTFFTKYTPSVDCPPKAYRMLEVGETFLKGDEWKSTKGVWKVILTDFSCSVVGGGLSSYPVGFYRRPITTPQYRMLESGEEIKPGDEYLTHGREWRLAEYLDPQEKCTKDAGPFRRAI